MCKKQTNTRLKNSKTKCRKRIKNKKRSGRCASMNATIIFWDSKRSIHTPIKNKQTSISLNYTEPKSKTNFKEARANHCRTTSCSKLRVDQGIRRARVIRWKDILTIFSIRPLSKSSPKPNTKNLWTTLRRSRSPGRSSIASRRFK